MLKALKIWHAVAFALLVIGSSAGILAQSPAPRDVATVSFAFDRPGLQVPRFTLRIGEDGSGSYKGEEMAPKSPYPGVSTPPQPIDRQLNLSEATAKKIFALARGLHNFNTVCASSAKNIADTGKKTLSYKGPDGEGSCLYNYSDNKSVMQLTDLFQGIAATMDYGRRLDHLHRYDRLGLDAELDFLAQQATSGRALELGTIEPSLRSIAADSDIMLRARTRANALLMQVPGATAQAVPPPH